MKKEKIIGLIIGIIFISIIISLSFLIEYVSYGTSPTWKSWQSEEVNDSTGCYVRVDDHFTVKYQEEIYAGIKDPNYDRWILSCDGKKTETFIYASMCEDRQDLVRTIMMFHYSDGKQVKKKVYKPCN
jgi:hypothetical protein